MAARKKKTPAKPKELSEEQKENLVYILGQVGDAVDRLKEFGQLPNRELSLALTNIQQGEMWMLAGLDEAGINIDDYEDEDEPIDDDADGDEVEGEAEGDE